MYWKTSILCIDTLKLGTRQVFLFFKIILLSTDSINSQGIAKTIIDVEYNFVLKMYPSPLHLYVTTCINIT